jgi:DUF4097 and DUF4098 domain-containing protein YvlB
MATIPPPPYSPRDARRQARDYARMQRAYWRYQRGCRSSIVRPLLLITIGVVALLLETGKLNANAFWVWYAHWWPLLLIGAGVLLLAEYLLDRNNPCAGARGMGGVVGLIILLGLLGWGAHGIRGLGPLGLSDGDSFWGWGPEHDADVQLDHALTVAAGVTPVVNIENPRGDVTITASSDGQIHLSSHQTVHTASDSDASKDFRKAQPQIDAVSTGATVAIPDVEGMRQDLTLEVPPQAATVIHSNHGDVTVEGMKANVDITADNGDVKLEDIGSGVHIHMQHGDLSAHAIQGQAVVDGHGDDVTFSEIHGPASIDGDFFGDVHLEQIGGNVHFRSSKTQIDVPHLVGSLTLDSGDLGIDQAAGPIRILARAKDIDLSGITGDLQVADSDGNVSVGMGLPLGAIEIANHTGAVTLTVPEGASFSVEGSTSADESLHTDFPLMTNNGGGQQTLQGQVGTGGPKIEISTTHGSLDLRKGGAATAQEPGKARHFKSSERVQSTEQ